MVEVLRVAGVEIVAHVDLAVVVVDFHGRELDDEDAGELGSRTPNEDNDPRECGDREDAAGGAGQQLGSGQPDEGKGVGDHAEDQGVDVARGRRRAAGAAGVTGGDELEPDPDAEAEYEIAEGAGRSGERTRGKYGAKNEPRPR